MSTHEADTARPLVSTATILILSGFLIGVALGNLLDPELSPFLLMCGIAGLLCYITFEISNRRRLAELAHQGQREMEERLHKHLQSIEESAAKAPADDGTHLTLVGPPAHANRSDDPT